MDEKEGKFTGNPLTVRSASTVSITADTDIVISNNNAEIRITADGKFLINGVETPEADGARDIYNAMHAVFFPPGHSVTGWLGGNYDDTGFYRTKADAERGYRPDEKIWDLVPERLKGKRVRITFDVIEE